MLSPDEILAASFFTVLALFSCVVVIDLRLRRLLRNTLSESSMEVPPPISLQTSPMESLRYMRTIITRRHAHHPDTRVRVWGDLLLVCVSLELVAMGVFTWALLNAGG
jgi:hypothetical protein